ncbi:NADH dehydrogenase Fe-S protein subunit 4 ndufs4 [Tyrophagus putrescentiae]|nr:NADH dehydrogenase Fe-S protein subunit 4 ndufs4 [Tyrophagus putrescentiae]
MALNLLKLRPELSFISRNAPRLEGNSPGRAAVWRGHDLRSPHADTPPSGAVTCRSCAPRRITVDQPTTSSRGSACPRSTSSTGASPSTSRRRTPCSRAPDTQKWKLDYENRERWENPLMGWTSTSKEDAIEYCERHGLTYQVDEPQERKKLHKLYADNFSWSKRTRVGSK